MGEQLKSRAEIPHLQADFSFVPSRARVAIAAEVEKLLRREELQAKVAKLLTVDPGQRELDLQQLVDWDMPLAESVAVTALLERTIAQRWTEGNYKMHCDISELNLSTFEGLHVHDYEHLPTQIHPHSQHGGVGKLSLVFPAGLQEAKFAHSHPGSRIVTSLGRGKLNSKHLPDGAIDLEEGDVILMPRQLSHNFEAHADANWKALSLHLPYVGIGPEAIIYDDGVQDEAE